jgi:hypothetical protein
MQNEQHFEEHSLLGSGATEPSRSFPKFLNNLPLSSSGSKDTANKQLTESKKQVK